ncbi:MAG TPA: glycosyltransferase family 2 protein [Candidatus Limnocylindria bacterium]|nr:glycosyltransferase family 2 protein [Candidatus Limnocylindria bacterium]
MAPALRTSVIIRCFNEERHIGRLLSGLVRQTQPPDQIVVVDSGSTDATLAIARRFPVEIHTIEPEQFSFGRSLNIGCRAATGDLLVFASAHVTPVYDTWLAELTAPFADPKVALAYGRQQGNESTKYSEHRVMARWFPAKSTARQKHPFSNNANAAVRRSIWETQPYDEDLTGLEDLDWAKKALEAGHAIAYVATAPVVHAHEETWSGVVNRYRREAIAHKRIYQEHGMSAFEALRLAVGNIASDYIHAVRDRVLIQNLGSIPAFRIAQFYGTYRGFRQRGEGSAVLRRRFYYPHGWRRPVTHEQPANARPIRYDDPEHGAE